MDSTIKKYNYWQWRTLIALMVGYVFYYFLRKNFSAAIPAMEASLGLSKVQLGTFLTLNGIVYGVSRMINGVLADRYSKRKLMTLGLLLSCVINLAICFSPKMNGFLHLLDAEGKATIGLVYLIGLGFVGILTKRIRQMMEEQNCYSLLDFLSSNYDKKVTTQFNIVCFVMYLFLLSSQFVAMYQLISFMETKMVDQFIPYMLVSLAVIALFLYPIIGGIRKDIQTDIIQMIVLLIE